MKLYVELMQVVGVDCAQPKILDNVHWVIDIGLFGCAEGFSTGTPTSWFSSRADFATAACKTPLARTSDENVPVVPHSVLFRHLLAAAGEALHKVFGMWAAETSNGHARNELKHCLDRVCSRAWTQLGVR